jgi:hypothetical protein
MTRALVMMEIKEAMKNPAVQAIAAMGPEELMPHIVQIKDSEGMAKPYFRVSVVYACKSCTPQMERQLAKAPSHCIVEINRGPGVDKIVAGPGT